MKNNDYHRGFSAGQADMMAKIFTVPSGGTVKYVQGYRDGAKSAKRELRRMRRNRRRNMLQYA